MRGWRAREREWERESERLGRKEHQQLSWDGASHRVGTSESQFLGLCTVAISGRSIPCSSQDWPPIGRRATVPSRDFQELGEGGGERHPAGLICGALAKESPHFIGVYKVMSNKQQPSYPRAAVRMSALSSQRLFGRSCCRHALLPVTQPCAQWGGQESSSHWAHPWFSNRAKVAQSYLIWGVHPRHSHPLHGLPLFLLRPPTLANSSSFISPISLGCDVERSSQMPDWGCSVKGHWPEGTNAEATAPDGQPGSLRWFRQQQLAAGSIITQLKQILPPPVPGARGTASSREANSSSSPAPAPRRHTHTHTESEHKHKHFAERAPHPFPGSPRPP